MTQKLDQALEKLQDYIEPGMVVGFGFGKTVEAAIDKVAALTRQGALKNIRGIPSCIPTEDRARSWGIELVTFEDVDTVDVTINQADELDEALNYLRCSGSILEEKIIAQSSARNIVIVEESAVSARLGTKAPVPVEVVPLAVNAVKAFLEYLGATATLRTNVLSKAFRTTNRNLILDADFGAIDDPEDLSSRLLSHAGIVDHGLFLRLATDALVYGDNGFRHLTR